MSIKKLTKAQQVAEPKKRKKLTVEENDPKAAKKAEKDAVPQKKTAVSLTKRRDAAFPLRYAFAAGCSIVAESAEKAAETVVEQAWQALKSAEST